MKNYKLTGIAINCEARPHYPQASRCGCQRQTSKSRSGVWPPIWPRKCAPSARQSQPRCRCRRRRRHCATSSLRSRVRLNSRSAVCVSPALRRCDVTNHWSVRRDVLTRLQRPGRFWTAIGRAARRSVQCPRPDGHHFAELALHACERGQPMAAAVVSPY